MSDEITEVRLNASLKMRVMMQNGLDIKCPRCAQITAHDLATPNSVRCSKCKREVKLIWV